jgi:hypothetical protein
LHTKLERKPLGITSDMIMDLRETDFEDPEWAEKAQKCIL